MNKTFDSRTYWKERLKKAGDSLRGVGHKGFNEKANSLMYRKVQQELEKVLKENKIDLKGKKVLDAGSGIGMFTKFYLSKGSKVTAVDISKDALEIIKRRYPTVSINCQSLEDLKYPKGQLYDVVHCFDVLYHITDDDKWEKSLDNLGKLSKNYVIIHNIQNYWGKILDSLFKREHIKVEKRNILIKNKLEKLGFVEKGYYPVHVLYVRPLIHLMVNLIPYPFYLLDKFLVSTLKLRGFESTSIRVFRRK